DDVALLRREIRLLRDAPERAVGLESRRTLGEDAVEVGHEAPALLDAVQELGRGCRRGGSLVKRESVDHLSYPFLNECGRNITHSLTLRQTRPGDMIHSGRECELREKRCAIGSLYPAKMQIAPSRATKAGSQGCSRPHPDHRRSVKDASIVQHQASGGSKSAIMYSTQE